MKFGAKLRSYAVPEWQQHYVDYPCLKALLKQQKKKIETSDAPGYLAKLFPTSWHPSSEKASNAGDGASLPLPAVVGPPGSRVAPAANKQTRLQGFCRLKEPLLQDTQQQQHQKQPSQQDHRSISLGTAADDQPEGPANKEETLRANCVAAFSAAIEKEKTKVANFFRDELGFLEDKLKAVTMELKAFNAARRRRLSSLRAEGKESVGRNESAQATAAGAGHTAGVVAVAAGSSEDKGTNSQVSRPNYPFSFNASSLSTEDEAKSEDAAYLRRLERILLLLLDTLEKLEVYRRLNLLALWKALKKRDKQLQLPKGTAVKDFERITAFFNQQIRIPPKTKRAARALYRHVAGEDSELSLEVLPLRAHEDLSGGGAYFRQEVRVSFLAGCLSVLLLLTTALLFMPVPPSKSFDYEGLMAVFPLFRLAFAWSFIWLSTASAMAVMERYGVNYCFLLDLAPRGQTSSVSFFCTAALHFVLTTATCALYLADSKLHLLGDGQMYHFYPLGLLLLQLLLLLFPSRALTYKARRQVLGAFFTVLKAGVFTVRDVKLVANIIGDVLTSLAKPLGDLQYLACYLSKGMDNTGPAQCYGDSLVRPVLLGLPFYLRLCQCFIRFRGAEPGGGLIHLMNMAKYACGILVLITTNVPWLDLGVSVYAMCLLWVFSYCLGSLFMLYWDVRVDWGLLPTPDRFIRMQGRLMYPTWIYGAIAVTNAMGRLTWAMTLMPISLVGNKSLSGNLVLLFISVIEIMRRGAWVVLRLENEHVNNSSRFRAILWVPPLHQTRLEVLEGDPLIQATTPSENICARGIASSKRQQF
ncbi:SPX domain-containing protein, putative [Eimeria necatrix]|uniref:SPX domain-containing protein, putative n=1 Tax=Eimeria necatrix TaxID=51315 RepID=U6MPU0_9EIME|nr:SPX domain-containing protein, putative [Eimeria necatrix]CDJ66016.1 SPX domain-containing protein, putative [Eimeria necatrix]